MKMKKRYLLLLAGLFATTGGILFSLPALFREQLIAGSIFFTISILGMILIDIAFGEEDEDEERIKKEFIGS